MYDDEAVMRGIEFHIKQIIPSIEGYSPMKELVLFLGHTGAGKSTLINYLMGHDFSLKRDDWGGGQVLYWNSQKSDMPVKVTAEYASELKEGLPAAI